jgi:hypothetical protein
VVVIVDASRDPGNSKNLNLTL